MLTFQYTLKLQQGASLDKTLRYSNKSGPIDLTGATAVLTVRAKDAKKTKLVELTTAGSAGNKITLGGTAGTIRIEMDYANSKKLTREDCSYTLHVTYASGFRQRLVTGDAPVELCDD